MALLKQEDWQASWITAPDFDPAKSTPGLERWLNATAADPQFKNAATVADTKQKLRDVRPAAYFRKVFTIDRPVKSALLYSTSAGYSEFYLSGQKIGDRVLNPAQTDYDKRIYYDVDDLTDRLSVGDHALAIHLGNGFYGERTAFGLDKLFYGEPAAIAQLEIQFEDGSSEIVSTDASWRAHPSPILKNGVYSGEVYDARKQVPGWSEAGLQASGSWRAAQVLTTSPTELLVAAEMPPVRRVTEVKPIAVYNPDNNVWTIDFGQNFTGLPTIDLSELGLTKGQTVIFRFAEWADDKGNIGMNSGGGAPRTKQVDAYVSDGNDDTPWSPSFTWHGFRYLEISGIDAPPPLDAITAHLTRTDIDRIGRFVSSDPLLNRIHETALWSFETNMVSVLSDCPIRERNGWTGDAHAIVQTASYNFAMGPFLDKYLGDFRTTDFISPAIVPGRRTHSGKIDWAAAEVFLTWEHYLHTGDVSVIERQYDSLLDYVAYVEKAMDDDRVTNPFHYYGDWCDALPELGMERPLGRCASFSTPGDLTATALMARVFQQMSDMAEQLGRSEEAEAFQQRYKDVSAAFDRAYYQGETTGYGSQTANAMALQFGIAPEHKRSSIAAAIDADVREKWNGHASVGALGQTWLYPALSDAGYDDTAFGIFKAEGPPGYSYLFDTLNGTTLWENITGYDPKEGAEPGRSLNHPFKGGYDAWFYSGLGGINPDPAIPGYKSFFLRPVFPTDLDQATVSLETGYGTIASEWKRDTDGIVWRVEVPSNTSATVNLPGMPNEGRKIGPGKHRFVLSSSGGWNTSENGGT
ncbi:family 78 glycoside hydrolase catalytic domain [Altererythrobacter sp. RZ02]|uniref:alpha-L-rhamnosidase n=2 Tax=Pontixanthobacter rizhaonensis TaxID=2730337 RepID=A0A848QLL2_9SPHN|nr:family 78 glycoside hydrolase catalytic domain [Pontixanthobacter rizhaonensis]NMW32034.1 family 78 glycoside hydrolase catalytic domain [Pontixanthobacter rizhaonensis]